MKQCIQLHNSSSPASACGTRSRCFKCGTFALLWASSKTQGRKYNENSRHFSSWLAAFAGIGLFSGEGTKGQHVYNEWLFALSKSYFGWAKDDQSLVSLHIRKVHNKIQYVNAGQIQCHAFFVTPCSPRDDFVVSCRTFLPTALCQGWKEKQLAIFLLHQSAQLQCIQQLPTTSQIPMGLNNRQMDVILESHTRISQKKGLRKEFYVKHV